jgi:cobyrinic acid a,c-diamide synthase
MLQLAGVQLVPFSPLHDCQLPPGLSGVLVGGGAVAQHAAQLSCNTPMLEALRAFAGAGGLVLGEAGGLLYLSRSLQWQQEGQRHAMGECCSAAPHISWSYQLVLQLYLVLGHQCATVRSSMP